MPAAFTGEEIPCRPKGRPAFRGGPRNRDFSRKKRFLSAYVLAASEICLTQISTPRLGLWGNFPAGRRRQRRNRPFAVNQHKENGDSTPPVRRRRKTLTAFFAWRRGTACFAAFFTPKKGSCRTHPCEGRSTLFRGQTLPKLCVGMSADESTATFYRIPGSQPECLRHSRRKKSLAGQKNGRHFAVRRKTGIFPAKSAFSCFRTRGKRNCPSAISTPRFGLCKNPRLAGLRAFLSYRRAIFMGHSVYALSSGDRPA